MKRTLFLPPEKRRAKEKEKNNVYRDISKRDPADTIPDL